VGKDVRLAGHDSLLPASHCDLSVFSSVDIILSRIARVKRELRELVGYGLPTPPMRGFVVNVLNRHTTSGSKKTAPS